MHPVRDKGEEALLELHVVMDVWCSALSFRKPSALKTCGRRHTYGHRSVAHDIPCGDFAQSVSQINGVLLWLEAAGQLLISSLDWPTRSFVASIRYSSIGKIFYYPTPSRYVPFRTPHI